MIVAENGFIFETMIWTEDSDRMDRQHRCNRRPAAFLVRGTPNKNMNNAEVIVTGFFNDILQSLSILEKYEMFQTSDVKSISTK